MKRLLFGLLFASFTMLLFATNVELQDAKIIAKNAYYQKLNTYLEKVSYDDVEIIDYYMINQNGESVIYAFNFENYGFVLIAADDAIEPVLGYTFNSHYSSENQPEGFKGTLWEYGEHITYLRSNKIEASPEISRQWDELVNFKPTLFTPKDGGKDIEPLLTCTWGQGSPYNYYCPERLTQPNSNNKALVGCVATAMSQIMLYWRYPLQGTGSHSYYLYPYGTISANFGETTYEWDAMLDNISQINPAVAIINFHAGVSVNMDYFHEAGSAAYSDAVDDALKTYFNYSNTCFYQQRTGIPLNTWEGYVQDQLEDSCPVYYSGQSSDGGHAFVLDGYHESDGLYHFNFGWSGNSNGWYLITDAGGFSYQQGMVRNIFPADAGFPYGCTPDYELTYLTGSFEDGSGPQEDYDVNTNCTWLINPQTAQDSVTKIKLNFVLLDTENDDVITIYDGETTSDPVLGTYSGSSVPGEDIYSTGNKMLIVFEADGDVNTGTGFRVEYSTYQPSWCSGNTVLTAPSGSFDDGSGDFWYKNGTNCTWMITPEWASDITLTFTEFSTEEDVDLVKVYDATNNQLLVTLSGEYTSGNLPEPIFSENGELFVAFQTDGAFNGPGWTAEWEIGNTGIEAENAEFNSLLVYPNPAENILNISFELKDSRAFTVKLISVTGNVVYYETKDNFSGHYVNTIDLSELAKGVYFLNLSNETGTINKKVVVK